MNKGTFQWHRCLLCIDL